MLFYCVIVSIVICTLSNSVTSQEISAIRCNDYTRFDRHARNEDDAHIGFINYREAITGEWFYVYGILISDRYVITTASNIEMVPELDMFYSHVADQFFIEKKIISPFYYGQFMHNDIALLKLAKTDSTFRFACLLLPDNHEPIESKSVVIEYPGATHDFTEYSHGFCEGLHSAINDKHSCIDYVDFYLGSVLQYKINNVIYIKSVFGWIVNTVPQYAVGHNLDIHIDWIERIVWPELYELKIMCYPHPQVYSDLFFIDKNTTDEKIIPGAVKHI